VSERRYAVLIASSQYPNSPRQLETLRCPTHDVDGLNDLLASQDYGRFVPPVVLKNLPHNEVLKQINRALQLAGRDDLVLIYYSGHGKLNRAGRLHLTTVDTEIDLLDTTSIAVDRIRELIEISHSKKVIFILDCCYSGRVRDAFLKSSIDDQLQRVHNDQGIYILTASTGIQVAREKEGEEYSYFTKNLLDGIREGKADRDNDGLVSVRELYEYTVSQMSGYQIPMMWGLNVRGAEPVIARAGDLWKEKQRALFRKMFGGIEVRLWPEASPDYTQPGAAWGSREDLDRIFEEVKVELIEERAALLDSESQAALDRGNLALALDKIKTWLALKPSHQPALERLAAAERQQLSRAATVPPPRRPPRWAAYVFRPDRPRYVYPPLLVSGGAVLLVAFIALPLYGSLLTYGALGAAMGFAWPGRRRRVGFWLSVPLLLVFGFLVGLSARFTGYFTRVFFAQDLPLLAAGLLLAYGGTYAGARLSSLKDEVKRAAVESAAARTTPHDVDS
jgi:Caspase domain